MSSRENPYELIDRYLSNQLSDEDLTSFNEKLTQDHELRKELSLQMEIKEAILEESVIDFRAKVAQAISDKKQKSSYALFYRVAASISVVLVASVFIYNSLFNKSTPEAIFDKYFQPYDNLVSVRNDEEVTSDISKAMTHYDKGEYRKALDGFQSTNYHNGDLVALYMGVCYVYLDKLDSAQLSLSVSTNDKSKMSYYPALYYKGLIHLKNKDLEKAKSVFSDLKKGGTNPYKTYAAEILNELK